MSGPHIEYSLVFEGAQSDDANDQIVKALTSEFGLSESAAEIFVKRAPITIKRATEITELDACFNVLKDAGAHVSITDGKGSEPLKTTIVTAQLPTGEGHMLGLESSGDEEIEIIPIEKEDSAPEIEIEFEAAEPELEAPSVSAPPVKPDAPSNTGNELTLELDEPIIPAQTLAAAATKSAALSTPAPKPESAPPSEEPASIELAIEEHDLTLAPESTPPAALELEPPSGGLDLTIAPDPLPAASTKSVAPEKPPAAPATVATELPNDLVLSTEPEPVIAVEAPPPTTQAATSEESEPESIASKPKSAPPGDIPLAELMKMQAARRKAEAAPADAESAAPITSDEQAAAPEAIEESSSGKTVRSQSKTEFWLIVTLVSITFLGGNWYYFTQMQKAPVLAIPVLPNESPGVVKPKAVTAVKKELPKPQGPTVTWKGVKESEEYKLNATLMTISDFLNSSVIELTSPEPAELTPEQIVRGDARAPWLVKLNIDVLEPIVLGSGEEQRFAPWRAKAAARAIVDYLGKRKRIVVPAVLSVTPDLENKRVSLALAAGTAVGDKSEVAQFSLSPNGEGVSVALATSVMLDLVPEKKPEEEEKEAGQRAEEAPESVGTESAQPGAEG